MGLFRRTPPENRIEEADALIAQGQAVEDAGRPAEAEALYRKAIEAAPRHARAHLNLGNALRAQGRLQEAADANRAAIGADAGYGPAHCNLGVVLLHLGNVAEARRHFERALELAPLPAAAVHLARLAQASGAPLEAIAHLERALAIDPAPALLHVELGQLRLQAGRMQPARDAFAAALERDPQCAPALLAWGRLEFGAGEARALELLKRGAAAAPHDAEMWAAYLMALNVRSELSAEDIAREHFRFGAEFPTTPPAPRPAVRTPRRPLRVGYVSGDFRASPVAWFIAPVLQHHDRQRIESFCYSNAEREDEVTARLRPSCGHWRPIHGLDDAAVESLVRSDGIDVLVDLSGHSAFNRLGVFARRAAPTQVTWLGYLNTTGLRSMDYRITDRHTDPEGATEALHTERLARMPHSQWCWVPFYDERERGGESAPGDAPVFASFNHTGKINGATLDLWCAILRELPGATLRVHGATRADFVASLLRRVEERGIARERVTPVPHLPIDKYFDAFRHVDIALDTFPYNGGTTTFVTYWMGVPMVALVGARGIARGSYSIAKSAGFDELIARDADEYLRANLRLARDAKYRRALAAALRARLMASPLADARRFTRDLETLYEAMASGSL